MANSLREPPFDVICCDDPRVRMRCPKVTLLGESARVAAFAAVDWPIVQATVREADQPLTEWMERIAAGSLEDVVDDLLLAWYMAKPMEVGVRHRLSEVKGIRPRPPRALMEAVALRLGLRGSPPVTLIAASEATGMSASYVGAVTREIEQLVGMWLWAPALDRALALAATTEDPATCRDILLEHRLTTQSWHPDSVNRLARLCGRGQRIGWRHDLDPAIVRDVAERLTRHRGGGVAPIADIADLASRRFGRVVTPEHVAAALADERRVTVTETWAWRTGTRASPPGVIRIARGMLVLVGNPLPLATIYEGWLRRIRFRYPNASPSIEALGAILGVHKDFFLDRRTDPLNPTVTLTREFSLKQVYDAETIALIEAIREAPDHAMTAADLREIADDTFGERWARVYPEYHEAFVKCDPKRLTLIGLC